MNGLLRIRQRYQGLAQSDKKLADYLLLQPDTARHLSSQQLANEAGVSQSSVVKFAQKLGYKGFPALKLALSEALASQPESPSVPIHNQIRGDDPLRLVGEKLIKENTAAMYATLNVNSEEKLHECVTMLRSARRIILTGIERQLSTRKPAGNFSPDTPHESEKPAPYTHEVTPDEP